MARASVNLVILCLLAASGLLFVQTAHARSSRSLLQATNGTAATNGAAYTNGAGASSANKTIKASNKTADDGSVTRAIKVLNRANISVSGATIFAPTDKAFADLKKALNLSAADYNTTRVKNAAAGVLKLHVVPGALIKAADIKDGNTTVATLYTADSSATPVSITVTKKTVNGTTKVYVRGPGNKRGARVLKTDISFNNNIVHVIDKVLLP